MLARWSQLKSLLGTWRAQLGQSRSFQQFKREADEAEGWVGEKMVVACDDSYKDPTDLPVSLCVNVCECFCVILVQGKLQKHQAFEAEVVANKERIFSAISMGESQHKHTFFLTYTLHTHLLCSSEGQPGVYGEGGGGGGDDHSSLLTVGPTTPEDRRQDTETERGKPAAAVQPGVTLWQLSISPSLDLSLSISPSLSLSLSCAVCE